jgi:hypothetical protein
VKQTETTATGLQPFGSVLLSCNQGQVVPGLPVALKWLSISTRPTFADSEVGGFPTVMVRINSLRRKVYQLATKQLP